MTMTNKPDYKTLQLFKRLIKAWMPPKDLTVSQWADLYRKLSPESSAEPGQWDTNRAPYQREIMDAISDSNTETVVIESSSQVGKSEILNNTLGYYIDQDPAPMLFLQPTELLAKGYGEDRIDPMIRDCPTLASKVKDPKSRDSGNTKLRKSFPGGQVTLLGANAPGNLAGKPIRILLCDEVDRYPQSAGIEGDPLNLVRKRTVTFWNRKIVIVSTPTIKGASRIETEYESSTKEKWNVPCPSCGKYQPYAWPQLKYKINDDDTYELFGYVCKECGCVHSEKEWKKGKGKWIAENPSVKGKRGFHLNEMTSPWRTWQQILEDYIEAKKSPETLKVWTNTSLGESYEAYGDLDADELLLKRRQMYNCEVPKDVLILTAAVDTQDNRLEYEIVGWGLGKKTWGIKYGVIMGDPRQQYVWDTLDVILKRPYIRADGLALNIMTTCIDSGGHCTDEVYKYCKANEQHRVWAIKGRGGLGLPFIQRPKAKNNKGNVWLFIIGVDVGKDTIAGRLKVTEESKNGYCHFPMEEEKGYNEQYFEGLTSERRVVKYLKGKASIYWEKKSSNVRNEPFDIRNYATAAFEILNPDLESLSESLNGETIVKAVNKLPQRRRGVIKKGLEY